MPTLEQFAEFLARPEEISVAVDDHRTGRIGDLGQCYAVDLTHGHASFAVIADPAYYGTLALGEAHRLLLRYFFDVMPVHKICAETPEFNCPNHLRKDGTLRGWDHEGTLRRHVYRGGRLWDVACFAQFRPESSA